MASNPMDRKVLEVRFNTGVQLGARTVLSISNRPEAKVTNTTVKAALRRDPAGIVARFVDHNEKTREVLIPYAQITFIELVPETEV